MTPKTHEALQRLMNNPDFKVYVAHLEVASTTATKQLFNAQVDETRLFQGRCQTYQHILGEIENAKKQSPT